MIQDLAGGVSVSQQSDRRVGSKRSVELRLNVNQVLGPVESEAEELQPDEVKRLLRSYNYRYCRQSGLDRQRSTAAIAILSGRLT